MHIYPWQMDPLSHCNYITAQVKFTARVTIKFTARVIQFCEAQPISAISLKISTPKLQLLHNTELDSYPIR